MADLFKKLNVLIRASLNDLADLEHGTEKPLSLKLGKNIDRDIQALHERLRDAEVYESQLKARIHALQTEISVLDAQADDALMRGGNESARYTVEQMKRAEQRLHMTEADLREHQLATQELAQRIRELEYAVAEARKNAQLEVETSRSPVQAITDALQNLRGKPSERRDSSHLEEAVSTDSADVDADLERRRQRLSKPS